jgi:hypothetical protein
MFKLVKIESSVRVLNVRAASNQPEAGSSTENLNQQIYIVRGLRVMLDEDIAGLYGVGVKVLNKQIKRNIMRFPDNYMFQLTDAEYDSLRSQIATLKRG